MSEPRTEAGRQLAEWMRTHGAAPRPGITADDAILAIEEQAAAEARRELLCDALLPTETWGVMWCGLFRGHPTGGPNNGHHWFPLKDRRLIEEQP